MAKSNHPIPLIAPFSGIRYTSSNLSLLLCPPYDVISPVEQEELYRLHPHNAIRLELAIQENRESRYQAAARIWRQWLEEGILREEEDSLYVLRTEFLFQGKRRSRLGLFAALHLEAPQEGRVLPHEGTLTGPKEDRLALLEAARANFSPVWTIYRNPQAAELLGRICSTPPLSHANQSDGTCHSLCRVSEPAAIEEICQLLGGGPIFIADGHHRYETALAFSQQNPTESPGSPVNFVLSLLVEANDPGLVILPTHRVISDLSREQSEKIWACLWENCWLEQAQNLEDLLRKVTEDNCFFGLYTKADGLWGFTVGQGCPRPPNEVGGGLREGRQKNAPVSLLHRSILEPIFGEEMKIAYYMDAQQARAAVDSEENAVAFFLRPLRSKELIQAALAGERLPGKSTYFWPKIPAGLVMRSLR